MQVKAVVHLLLGNLDTPSQQVQEAIAGCLPPLASAIKQDANTIIQKLLEKVGGHCDGIWFLYIVISSLSHDSQHFVSRDISPLMPLLPSFSSCSCWSHQITASVKAVHMAWQVW